jgi:hypothetical protein
MPFKKLPLTTYVLLAQVFFLFLVTGCGGGGGGTGATPSPLSMMNMGLNVPAGVIGGSDGTITVIVDIISPHAISYAKATVEAPSFNATKSLAYSAESSYYTTFDIPSFSSATEQTKTYTVTIQAADAEGNTASTSSNFQVSAIVLPPPAPLQ